MDLIQLQTPDVSAGYVLRLSWRKLASDRPVTVTYVFLFWLPSVSGEGGGGGREKGGRAEEQRKSDNCPKLHLISSLKKKLTWVSKNIGSY